METTTTRILEATTPEQVDDVRRLFGEYASSLGWDTSEGWISGEIAGLPGTYAPPRGSLLLAYLGDEPAGAMGLQPVPEVARVEGTGAERAGELKRLFVRPQFRRHGVGRALMERAEVEGRARDYDGLLLTTSAEMMPLAQRFYEELGYAETAPYRNDLPYPDIRWMRKDLATLA
jgi:GNAT superfamily N-acetyltransferase